MSYSTEAANETALMFKVVQQAWQKNYGDKKKKNNDNATEEN